MMAPLITNKPVQSQNGTTNDACSNHRIIFLCSVALSGSRGGQVTVSQNSSLCIVRIELQSKPLVALSCFAHLPGLEWHDQFVRHHPPTPTTCFASPCDISTWAAGSVPSFIPVLAEWAPGSQAMLWHSTAGKPG